MEKTKNAPNFVITSQALNKHIKRLKHKEKEIQAQINALCQLLDIKEPTVSERIRQL